MWLLIRRPVSGEGEVKYYLSNAVAETPLEVLALVSGCRVRVEEYLEDGKSFLGMSQYECRSWAGWHHHMSLVALA
ncbi:MAG: IS701 family transposase, partial [Planctomycetes bacterium]|nr:IS701 family transposase [Planctomycetota bacterium]